MGRGPRKRKELCYAAGFLCNPRGYLLLRDAPILEALPRQLVGLPGRAFCRGISRPAGAVREPACSGLRRFPGDAEADGSPRPRTPVRPSGPGDGSGAAGLAEPIHISGGEPLCQPGLRRSGLPALCGGCPAGAKYPGLRVRHCPLAGYHTPDGSAGGVRPVRRGGQGQYGSQLPGHDPGGLRRRVRPEHEGLAGADRGPLPPHPPHFDPSLHPLLHRRSVGGVGQDPAAVRVARPVPPVGEPGRDRLGAGAVPWCQKLW